MKSSRGGHNFQLEKSFADAVDELPVDLEKLLDEPEITLMMRADGICPVTLLRALQEIATGLHVRRETQSETASTKIHMNGFRDDAFYRPGVGILLLNGKNEVFVGRRIDVGNDTWKMPQGGIEPGESPREAAFRELREEIGTAKATVVAESRQWMYYDLPADIAATAWGGKFRGQRQKWFVMMFNGDDQDIDVRTEHPEFSAWRWVSPSELPKLAVSFKRRLYESALGAFSDIFRD